MYGNSERFLRSHKRVNKVEKYILLFTEEQQLSAVTNYAKKYSIIICFSGFQEKFYVKRGKRVGFFGFICYKKKKKK